MDDKDLKDAADEFTRRLRADGAATISTKDGRVIGLSVQLLEGMLEEARSKKMDHCLVLIRNPTVN